MFWIMRKINLVSRCQGLFLADRLPSTELAAGHHSYLLTVARQPGISQEALARELCVNKSNVARNLAHLEEHGFVERRNSPQDRRVLQVYPTQKLLEILPQLRQTAKTWNAYLTADFTEEEMTRFQDCLDRIVARATAYREKGEEALR